MAENTTPSETGPLAANLAWQVGVVARTVEGDVTLRMTEEQAAELRDCLNYLTGDGDE